MRRQDTQSTSLVVSLLNANRASETPELVATESVTTAGRGRKRKANNEVKRDSLRKRAERATHKLEVVQAKATKEISQLVEFERTTLGSLVTIHIVCVIHPFPFYYYYYYYYYFPKTMDNTTRGGMLVMKERSDTGKGPLRLTRHAMMRCASLPTSMSDYHGLSVIGPGVQCTKSIRNCRKVVAVAMKVVNAVRARELIASLMPPCMQPVMHPLPLEDTSGRYVDFAQISAVIEPLDPLINEPLIVSLKWKFDSTPDKATFSYNAGDDDAIELMENDCFAQQGTLFVASTDGTGDVTGIPLATPQSSIPSGSAKNMLAKLYFVSLFAFMDKLVSKTSLREVPGRKGQPFVFMLSITTDAHSANLKLIRHLVWKFRRHRNPEEQAAFLFVLVSALCQTHQLSLVARSQYARLGGRRLSMIVRWMHFW